MKLGLVGTVNNSGLGIMAKMFQKHIGVDIQLVIPHRKKGMHLDDVKSDYIVAKARHGLTSAEIEKFIVTKPDIVVFLEFPYDWDLPKRLAEAGIKVAWIPMLDSCGVPWMQKENVIDCIDMFIAPTKIAATVLKDYNLPVTFIPWGIDTEYFTFKQRGRGREITFLHNAGYGGDGKRKGWDLVLKAWQKVRHHGGKLIVHSQISIPRHLLRGVDFRKGDIQEVSDLYAEGDVYLSPSRKEGLGLPFREAMACGMPAIVTDAVPLNEVVKDPDLLIKVSSTRKIGPVQDGVRCEPDINDLVAKMEFILTCGTVPEKSKEARAVIDSHYSWNTLAPMFRKVFEEIVKKN